MAQTNLNGEIVSEENAKLFQEVTTKEEISEVTTENNKTSSSEVDELDSLNTEFDSKKKELEEIPTADFSDKPTYEVVFKEDEPINQELKEKDKVKVSTNIFEIERVEILKPKQFDIDGNVIEPITSTDGKSKYYTSKVNIFYKDSVYKSVVPKISWFKNVSVSGNNKSTILIPWFNTKYNEDADEKFVSEISKLYFKYCNLVKKPYGKISMKKFFDGLIGKKVRLKETSGIYNKIKWTRLDIYEFIE